MALPVPQEVAQEIQAVADTQQDLIMEAAPPGEYSKGALSSLAKSINDLFSKLDKPALELSFEQKQEFPQELAAELLALQEATQAAANERILEPDMVLDVEKIQDDKSLNMCSGRIKTLAKDKDFIRWISEEVPEEDDMMSEEEPMEMNMEQMQSEGGSSELEMLLQEGI